MSIFSEIAQAIAQHGWFLTGVALTIGYGAVLILMIRKVLRDQRLPENQKPGPKPLFYFGQAYLAFLWPIPLFLVLEALDALNSMP